MSRSRKKIGIYKDRGKRDMKRLASKKARRTDLDDGCSYKRVFNSYDISDWKWFSDDDAAKRK